MEPSLLSAGRAWFARRALFFRVLGVGFLVLLLLIPLGLVDGTLGERQARHAAARAEITSTWGRTQRLVGPVLVVPYRQDVQVEEWVVVDGRRVRETRIVERTGEAWFLPEDLRVQGELMPSELSRGIFRTTVYRASAQVTGRFRKPDFAPLGLEGVTPAWERARLGFGFDDPRGLRGEVKLAWGGTDLTCEPGARLEGFVQGLHRPLDLRAMGETTEFRLDVELNGSEGFAVVPVGRLTTVDLRSTWPSPRFEGASLPVKREVGPGGFAATWETSHYARAFPQQWSQAPAAADLLATAMGVSLLDTVTAYRTVERAIKHGVLFITLVFAAFFLFETLRGRRLHALNYLLVGAALCLFYLALLALSEFIPFGAAYVTAAAASTLLIGLYTRAVLGAGGGAFVLSALLVVVYGYLYLVLRLEDFALLAGTGGLFVLLAAIMYATRHLRAEAVDDAAEVRP
jgi:inner membrane protein